MGSLDTNTTNKIAKKKKILRLYDLWIGEFSQFMSEDAGDPKFVKVIYNSFNQALEIGNTIRLGEGVYYIPIFSSTPLEPFNPTINSEISKLIEVSGYYPNFDPFGNIIFTRFVKDSPYLLVQNYNFINMRSYDIQSTFLIIIKKYYQ